MIKYAAKKKKNFQHGGPVLYPRGVNENKVNAFASYYPRWKRGHQLCREAERQEIKTASDMRSWYAIPGNLLGLLFGNDL